MNDLLKSKLLLSSSDADVGYFTYGTPKFLRFHSAEKALIGKFCQIADNVTIILGGEHFKDRITTYPMNALFEDLECPWHEYSKGKTIIGNDVWIGYGSIILSGVKIGDGAVIGAGSVVSNNVDPYSVVAGCPAKTIKMRFEEKKIKYLIELKWWDWSIDNIKRNLGFLMSKENFVTNDKLEESI